MHKISIKPGGGISLAPFADVHKLAGISQNSGELSDDTGTDDAETEEFGQVTTLAVVTEICHLSILSPALYAVPQVL